MDAIGRDDVAEAIVVVTEELREVVEENKENSEGAAVETVHRLGKLSIPGMTTMRTNIWDKMANGHDIDLRNGLRNLNRAVSS